MLQNATDFDSIRAFCTEGCFDTIQDVYADCPRNGSTEAISSLQEGTYSGGWFHDYT